MRVFLLAESASQNVYWEEELTQRVESYVFLDGVKFTGRRPGPVPGCVNLCCRPCLFLEIGSLSLNLHLLCIT